VIQIRQTIASWRAHKGFVRGLSISHLAGHEENEFILSCSEDKSIKMWHYPTQDYMSLYITDENQFQSPAPVVTYLGKYPFSGIDHQRKSSQFVTCSGPVLELWEHHHSEPVKTLKWNALTQSNNFDVETITTVKFNPIETHVLAAAATDRSILLYDVKSGTAIKRVILKMNTNALCWNPMETFNFTVANEDHQCYTFDARKLDAVLNVHKDHVSAVYVERADIRVVLVRY
jgi:WD repeat and SOF domain-containing protein 1